MNEYTNYHNQEVHLIVDGRGYNSGGHWGSESGGMSLELEATIVGESENLLKLEEIRFKNPSRDFRKSPKESLKKDYVIGVFEIPDKEISP